MAGNIKGITVEIGGDTTGLNKALKSMNTEINSTQKELKEVTRLLKLDPTNTTLLRQKQELLTKAIQESKDKLEALKNAKSKADQDMADGTEINQEQYRKLCREIEATELQVRGLEKEAGAGSVALEKLAATADKVADGANRVADATKAISAAAAGLMVASGKFAADFEDSFAKVSTLLEDSRTDYEAYKNDIIRGSNETGVAITDFSEAVYSAISASVDQADAVNFTTAAVKLAKGGFTDTAKAVDVMTTAINGYSLSAEDAARISDMLITTQNLGKTTVDELASSMGKVIPIASATNYSMEELSTAYALLTRNGIATAEAGTYMKSMLNELSKSGSTADLTLRELTGKGFADLKADGVETSEILAMLAQTAEADGKTLKDMFSSVEAGSAAMVLARSNGEEYNEILRQMQDSAGATESAFEKVGSTTSQQISKAINEVKNLAVELGGTLLPAVNSAVSAFRGFVDKLKALDEGQIKLLATILLVIAAISPLAKLVSGVAKGVSLATGAINTFGSAMAIMSGAAASGSAAATGLAGAFGAVKAGIVALTGPIGIVVAAVAALGAAIAYLWKNNDEFRGKIVEVWENVQGKITSVVDAIKPIVSVLAEHFKMVWETITGIFRAAMDALGPILTAMLNLFNAVFDRLYQSVMPIVQTIVTFIIDAWNACKDGVQTTLDGIYQIFSGIFNLISTAVSGIVRIITDLVRGDFGALKEDLASILQGMWSAIQTIWNGICTTISGVLSTISALFSTAWAAIGSLLSAAWNGFLSTITVLCNSIKATIVSIWNAILSFFQTLPATLASIGRTIFSSLAGAISGMAGTVYNAAVGCVNSAVDWLKSLPGQAVQWGRDFITGFSDGIIAAANALIDKVRGIADKIASFLHFSRPDEGPLREYEKWPVDFIHGYADKMKSALPYLQRTVKDISASMAVMVQSPAPAPVYAGQAPTTNTTVMNQTLNINSPKPISPGEAARQTRMATRDLIDKLKG